MKHKATIIKYVVFMIVTLFVSSLLPIPILGQAKTTIEFFHYQWLEPGKKDILGTVVDMFEEQFPHINVKRTPVPFTDARDVLFTRIAGGTAPDVAVITFESLGKMMDSNYLEPLNQYIEFDLIKDKLVGSAELARGDDRIYYAIVQENIPNAMFYNKRLFAEEGLDIPTTIDEFFDVSKKLTKPELGQYAYFIVTNPAETGRMFFDLSKWVYGFDGRWARNGELTVNEPNVVKAIEMYKQVYDSKTVPWGIDKSTARTLFSQGKIAMCFDGSYFYEWVHASNPETAKELGAARIPLPSGTSAGEVLFLGIPRNAPNKAAAAEFIKLMLNPDIQAKYLEATRVEGAMKGMASEEFMKAYSWYQAFDGAPMIPSLAEGFEEFHPEIQQIVTNKVGEVLHRGKPAQTAMNEAQREIEDVLSRKR
ncbi:MAG TPA: sugar ABC transporter substrate-binding protein [Tepidimicrobium sp.]|nr:sugar ABC transporter substrate-binding protein [Tepidimicrobium sp.]